MSVMERARHRRQIAGRLFCCLWLLCATAAVGCRSPKNGTDASSTVAGSGGTERLVVFVRDSGSAVATEFAEVDLPALREFAASEKIDLQVIDVAAGAPADVTITPLISYLTRSDHAIYQGRYRNTARLRNFIRTFRAVPQPAAENPREDIFAWRSERATVVAPLKITELTGDVPPDYTAATFAEEVQRAFAVGFKSFASTKQVALGRGDRIFYVDLYPYCDAAGTLHLTVQLYSQFHCKEAIFSNADAPFTGAWDQREQWLQQAGQGIEEQLIAEFADPSLGDGFDPVPSAAPRSSWATLQAQLPAQEVGTKIVVADLPLARAWTVVSPASDRRGDVVFRFASPLEFYSGQATETKGELSLPSTTSDGAGHFVVQTRSVSMGYPDIDEAIRGSSMLAVADHPEASFRLSGLTLAGELGFGAVTPVAMEGTFEMKGTTVPLSVRAQLEPIVGADGAPNLLLSGQFQLRLKERFGIEGPDGPAPANDTVLFDFLFRLAATSSAVAADAHGAFPERRTVSR
ncbi:MAG: YceI family protein [Planctomycetota bacterium]